MFRPFGLEWGSLNIFGKMVDKIEKILILSRCRGVGSSYVHGYDFKWKFGSST